MSHSVGSEEDVNIISRMILASRHRVVGKVLIVRVKIFKYQCCIFSQKCCGVPWFVFLTKLCLCKWGVISLISHAFQLMVFDVELSIWEDEDVTFNIPWTRCFPVNCQLNFFFIHQSQSASVKIIVSFTPEIDKKSESVSSLKVCCIYRAVFLTKFSKDCLLPYLLRLSWVMCSHNLFLIFVVGQGLISEFLIANDFILKLILFNS